MGKAMHRYALIETPVGRAAVVWSPGIQDKIVRIFLPEKNLSAAIKAAFPGSGRADSEKDLCAAILKWFTAGDWRFDNSLLDQSCCYAFQKKVLTETAAVRRGKVITYGGLAKKIAVPNAARAVGTALGRNPFPLVIPCHRVVRSDGALGGFGGGLPMKLKLLEMEGVEFDRHGRVRPEHIV
jgi:methylated-DNA-[protein]-cysteine S-methyltransferase